MQLIDFINKFFKKENSKEIAKERLKLVLVHDRSNVSPEILDQLKNEIIDVISKYVEIDREELDIQLTKTQTEEGERIVPALVANIPIKSVKHIEK
jgi:cell division topological specificity factor